MPSNKHVLFELAISNNLQHIAESVSEEAFLQILTILKHKPKPAKKLHKKLIEELYKSMKEDIFEEGSLQEAISRIDELAENPDLPEDERAWRPPGDVNQHLRSLDADMMKRECDYLEKLVSDKENENKRLIEKITEDRTRISDLDKQMMVILNRTPLTLQRMEKNVDLLKSALETLDRK